MNYNKIGAFIAAERKAKNLTQAKLAEKLFVSEKTISKWENGKGVPDTLVLPLICKEFNVSINELLSGERLPKEEYKTKAEEQLLNIQRQNYNASKLLLHTEIILGVISVITLLSFVITASYMLEYLNMVALPVIMLVVGILAGLTGIHFCLVIEQRAGYYECKHCGHRHVPDLKSVYFAMHIFRRRYIKCPHCKRHSWQKKVVK